MYFCLHLQTTQIMKYAIQRKINKLPLLNLSQTIEEKLYGYESIGNNALLLIGVFRIVLKELHIKMNKLFSIVFLKFHNKKLKLILKEISTTFLPLASELLIILCWVDFSDPYQVNIGHLYQILLIHFQYNKFLKLQVQQNFDTKLADYETRKNVVIWMQLFFFILLNEISLLLNSYIPPPSLKSIL